MKIAFIGQKGIPAVNGETEKYVENLATRFVEMGHNVFVYTKNNYTKKGLIRYAGVRLIHIPSIRIAGLDTMIYNFLSTIHLIFRRYDVIHYQTIESASLSFIPKFLKRKTLIISTFHSHNYPCRKQETIIRKYLGFGEKTACKCSDKIITTSKKIRNYVFSKYKIKASYIPNGARAEFNGQTKALERWGLKDKKYMLCIGKESRNGDLKKLVEAFKKIEDTNRLPNNMKLVIIMRKRDRQTRELEKENEERKNIIFSHSQTRSALEQLFSHSYLFIQPFESEGISIPLLEAMGHGIAPLVSNDSESIEVIGKCGFSFKQDDKEDLKNKLAYLINKPFDVEKMGKLSKERVLKEYGWDSIIRKILRIYELNIKSPKKLILRKIGEENQSYV